MTAKKILLVNDDKDLLYGMKIWLRANGFQVCYASDAASAITMAKAHRPDLIVLDIGLPGGDGYMTMARMRTLRPLAHIPIIVISARDARVHEKKALEAGAEAFFQKPFDNRQLLTAIQKALAPKTALPTQEGEALQKTPAEAHEKKILLIGDDQELLQGLRIRLRSYGFDVHLAPNAPLGAHPALKTRPDLIIFDIGLPGGDGYLNMTRLRSHLPLAHVPIILITAADASTPQERALKSGADAFFQKPIDNQQLLAAIQSALGEAGGPVTGSSLDPHPANQGF
jgi:chemotaxis family two-component system sensor histidine kinase/response regulator PixL